MPAVGSAKPQQVAPDKTENSGHFDREDHQPNTDMV
jgi:hypothetical protein